MVKIRKQNALMKGTANMKTAKTVSIEDLKTPKNPNWITGKVPSGTYNPIVDSLKRSSTSPTITQSIKKYLESIKK